jgi:hypothetical protein
VGEALKVPLHLEGPHGELVPQGGWFGVNTVRPSDHHRSAVLQRRYAEQPREQLRFVVHEPEGLLELQGARGIEDVRGGQTEVEVACDV